MDYRELKEQVMNLWHTTTMSVLDIALELGCDNGDVLYFLEQDFTGRTGVKFPEMATA